MIDQEPARPCPPRSPVDPPPGAGAQPRGGQLHCPRCKKPIPQEERDLFFSRTGLCFWCAYVDPQG